MMSLYFVTIRAAHLKKVKEYVVMGANAPHAHQLALEAFRERYGKAEIKTFFVVPIQGDVYERSTKEGSINS